MPIHGYPGNIITANPTAPTNTTASGVWTLEQQLQAQAAGNWPMAATQISRSLRFNSADSAYLNRTPASAGNRTTWTWSGWVKRGKIDSGATQYFLFSGYTAATDAGYTAIYISGDQLNFSGHNTIYRKTTQVFRDPSAWYHFVIVWDSSQGTASNRIKIYINGVQITAFATSNDPSSSQTSGVNAAGVHTVGANTNTLGANPFDGYLTEINFIDGSALTPNSFGFFDSDGIWTPKQYTGPYGTNGFFLNFSDNSGTTSTTLGKDYSGNGNNWTPNNFSVTAGAGNDSLVDSPTRYGTDTGAGGTVRGNYATLNPLANGDFGLATLTNGNLNASGGANYFPASATFALNSGKWYWEFLCGSYNANYPNIGIWVVDGWNIGSTPYHPGITGGVSARPNGGLTTPSGDTTDAARSFVTNDIINFAYDADTGKVYIGKNGTWFNSGVPASGTGSVYQYTAGTTLIPGGSFYNGAGDYNFGQRPFAYTAPSGFKALVTTNLPEPTIKQGDDYFNAVLYTGNGGNQTLTGLNFQPDFFWGKQRSAGTNNHGLVDSVRGGTNALYSNLTNAETSDGIVTSWNSNGVSIGNSATTNANGATYVAWNWKANGAGVTNTAGTITSTVSVNTTSGFSVVTFSSPASGGFTFGHGLGVQPAMFILKDRTNAGTAWGVWHKSLANQAQSYLQLNSTNAVAANANIWNNTAPTSTVISTQSGQVVLGSANCVAYCFAPVAGYSAFGSYTGNGSADGPFIYTGFRPKYVLIKMSSSTGDWYVFDTSRDPYNATTNGLIPNKSDADTSYTGWGDLLSNGFKIRRTDAAWNTNGGTYIYACFAENPFKLALAR